MPRAMEFSSHNAICNKHESALLKKGTKLLRDNENLDNAIRRERELDKAIAVIRNNALAWLQSFKLLHDWATVYGVLRSGEDRYKAKRCSVMHGFKFPKLCSVIQT